MKTLYAAVVDLPVLEAREQQGEVAVPRLPALERLLWRGERHDAPPDWRRWALGRAGLDAPGGDLPLGRLLAQAHGLAPASGDTWFAATPLTLQAGLSDVHVARVPEVPDASAAAALAARFSADWPGDALTLHALGAGLALQHRGVLEVRTLDPATLAGRNLAAGRPAGPDAGALERIMTELQMWLHARPLGAAAPRLNALWLWGAGRGALAGSAAWPAGVEADPYLGAARSCHPGRSAPDARFLHWSVGALVAAGESLASADRDWFVPLAHSLANGAIGVAELHVGATVVRLEGRQRRRVWIRPRPWWELGS